MLFGLMLITGAGHGLGRELALTFSAAGAVVLVTDLAADGVEATLALVREAGGRAAGGRAGSWRTRSRRFKIMASSVIPYLHRRIKLRKNGGWGRF
jgi:NAD(P)-dependent dehydrogenase (short-subunit alcohol dehydrogenase family)